VHLLNRRQTPDQALKKPQVNEMGDHVRRINIRGFTLVEMVAVIAIVGVLSTIAMPVLQLVKRRSQELELRYALRTIRGAIDNYKSAADARTIEVSANATGYPPTLEILVQGAVDPRTPDRKLRYFLRRLPRDPFADPTLPAAASWGLRSYDSPPESPQAGSDVFDVYSLSSGQAIDGSHYRSW
jgi:general secretion pathway protein G